MHVRVTLCTPPPTRPPCPRQDMFDDNDRSRRGYLDTAGLLGLLRMILPNVTEGELYYFQVRERLWGLD